LKVHQKDLGSSWLSVALRIWNGEGEIDREELTKGGRSESTEIKQSQNKSFTA